MTIPERVDGLFTEELHRLIELLRTRYPRVLEANRFFEEETSYENKPGANNLVDVLSHIGTLFEQASSLTRDQQRDQVTLIEDHLRRSMMESWEQLIDFRLGELDELWEEYLAIARPLQEEKKLAGPTARDLDRLRVQHKRLLDQGRSAKRDTSWDAWLEGTDRLVEACRTAGELYDKTYESVVAARQYREDHQEKKEEKRRWRLDKSWAVVVALLGVAAGRFLPKLLGWE